MADGAQCANYALCLIHLYQTLSHFPPERQGQTSNVMLNFTISTPSITSVSRPNATSVISVNQLPLRMPSWVSNLKLG